MIIWNYQLKTPRRNDSSPWSIHQGDGGNQGDQVDFLLGQFTKETEETKETREIFSLVSSDAPLQDIHVWDQPVLITYKFHPC